MDKKVIVALDKPNPVDVIGLAKQLDPTLCRVKVGKELFVAGGPDIVEVLMSFGFEVFLDLKFHDIPNTVGGAIRSACNLGVWMVNVHCLGGRKMMEAAVEVVNSVSNPPKLIGVTVLTSMHASDLFEVGLGNECDVTVATEVLRLAKLAHESGLDGVVCAALEAKMLRSELGKDFILVTPGIRLPAGSADDQARIMTPDKAIQAGADYLVVGRPITGAVSPVVVLNDINHRIASALRG